MPETQEVRHCLQFEFSAPAYEHLITLRHKNGDVRTSETVRDALRLLDWYLTLRDKGRRLAIVEPDGSVEVIDLEF